MNGSAQERDLMSVLRGHGFVPLRSPGSGTGDWDQPDVLAARQGTVLAVELKSGGPPANVDDDEVDALRRVADNFWAAALVGVRYKGDRTVYVVDPGVMGRTPSDHYSVPSHPEDLPWGVALPYTADVPAGAGKDLRAWPQQDVGENGVIYAADDSPPTLHDWLDAVTTAQQGHKVRMGVLDGDPDDADQDGADDPDDGFTTDGGSVNFDTDGQQTFGEQGIQSGLGAFAGGDGDD